MLREDSEGARLAAGRKRERRREKKGEEERRREVMAVPCWNVTADAPLALMLADARRRALAVLAHPSLPLGDAGR